MASLGRLWASIGAPGCRFGRRFGVSGRPFGVSGRALGVLGGHLGASGRPFGVCGSAWGGKFTDSDQVSKAKACIEGVSLDVDVANCNMSMRLHGKHDAAKTVSRWYDTSTF